ncbi:Di-copper centre-containing protein [Aulographum hederae CBS 113979]|uniref:Di-copper centre-containing protein n=1 Tax=Aulographum hederae CBS 113979 TaxID=1176131 RepID=A0A6G1HB05_9PEZI|nr:Di-copper centre-containing protein [Aulographum hederae CBS 113979]
MYSFAFALLFLHVPQAVFGLPASSLPSNDLLFPELAAREDTPVCIEPRMRKEWRTLSDPEKSSYISAIQCLWDLPSKGTDRIPQLRSRHDDFVYSHLEATRFGSGGIHGVGVFLPWHRHFIWVYENALINECNYTGAQPYWDYSLETRAAGGSWMTSPLFDAETGFGGDGVRALGGCIQDGPFKDRKITLGPGDKVDGKERCIDRTFSPTIVEGAADWDSSMMPLWGIEKFEEFQGAVEGVRILPGGVMKPGIHSVGHGGVGGEMQNVFSSPNDPLFFMHHAALDRVWALWQSLNPATRVMAIGGPTGMAFGAGGMASSGKTTLNTTVNLGFVADEMPIHKLMDTTGAQGEGILCYWYEKSPLGEEDMMRMRGVENLAKMKPQGTVVPWAQASVAPFA